MKSLFLVLACTLLVAALATPHWKRVDDIKPSDDHHVSFKIAFKKQNIGVLESLFKQMTDYYSPMFGKHLTNEQIKNIVSLPEEDIAAVEAYLMKDSGKFCEVIVRRSVHQDYLFVDTCAAQAQAILPNLQLAVYQKEKTGHLILRHSIMVDPGYNLYLLGLPHELHHNVEAIFDVTDIPIHYDRVGGYPDQGPFNPAKPWQPTVKEQTIASMVEYFGVTYDDIEEASYAADDAQVRQGVIEFNHAPFSGPALKQFQQTYNLPLNPIRKVVGSEESFGESIEANLDVQTITGMTRKAQTWDFVFDASASFTDVIETLMTTEGSPKMYSCSWGGNDSGYSQTTANAVNNDFLKLAATGVTFLIASGDSGPTLGASCKTFNPQYPAGSAYVVAVGGTVQDGNIERCWEDSSGGFSTLIDRPAYQKEAVEHYLTTSKLPAGSDGTVYTTTGRAYPDVAAFGAYAPVFDSLERHLPVGGTSGACPQFAAMLTLINILRYQEGKPALGGLVSTLYQLPKGIGFDVTLGETYAMNNASLCHDAFLPGFLSAPGWDATTGLGSPRYPVLKEQLLNIPGEA